MPTVGDGDCAVSIADQLGYHDYHTVWDDGSNAALKGKRPNPNQLVLGDDVASPVPKTKTVQKAVDNTWVLVVKNKKLPKLRVIVIDKEDKPLNGKKWRLSSPKNAKGSTGPDGLIEIADLDPQSKTGTLQVDWRETKKVARKKETDPKITQPTYPRPIKVSEFKDQAADPPGKGDDTVQWDLKIGSLASFDDVTGVQGRLHNLGFRCDPEGQAALTQADVKTYQRTRLKSAAPSGAPADIQTDIRNRHDNP